MLRLCQRVVDEGRKSFCCREVVSDFVTPVLAPVADFEKALEWGRPVHILDGGVVAVGGKLPDVRMDNELE